MAHDRCGMDRGAARLVTVNSLALEPDKGLDLWFFNPRDEPKRVRLHQNKLSSFSSLWLLQV